MSDSSRNPSFVFGLPRRLLRSLLPAIFAVAVLASFASASTNEAAPAAAAPASAALNPQIAERLLRANGYLEDNRLDDALSVVDELLRVKKLKPVDLAQIHRFRGYILLSKSKAEDAGKEFEAALAENALDDAARQGLIYSLAQIHTQAGRYDRARALIDEWFASASDPKPEAWFLKAMILVQQEDFQAALEPAKTAVARAPQPRESWLQLLAAVQFQLQDYASLAGTLRELVALSPSTKRYWVQLATIENSSGNDDGALATLGVADLAGLLSEDKELRQRARMCFAKNLPSCCSETLEEGLEQGKVKPDADAYQLLANCYIAARDLDKAAGPLAKAGELAENNKGYLLLGQLELQKERFAAATDALEKAKQKSKPEERPQVELLIGIAQLGSKRYDDAEKAFRVARSDEKTRPAAESYLKHLEQQRAIEQLRESTAKAGEDREQPETSAGHLSGSAL